MKYTIPPGFEKQTLYRNNSYIECMHTHLSYMQGNQSLAFNYQTYPATHTYTNIKDVCARKMKIYLPTIGYTHTVLQDDNENIYEIAYHSEFQSKTRGYSPSPLHVK